MPAASLVPRCLSCTCKYHCTWCSEVQSKRLKGRHTHIADWQGRGAGVSGGGGGTASSPATALHAGSGPAGSLPGVSRSRWPGVRAARRPRGPASSLHRVRGARPGGLYTASRSLCSTATHRHKSHTSPCQIQTPQPHHAPPRPAPCRRLRRRRAGPRPAPAGKPWLARLLLPWTPGIPRNRQQNLNPRHLHPTTSLAAGAATSDARWRGQLLPHGWGEMPQHARLLWRSVLRHPQAGPGVRPYS